MHQALRLCVEAVRVYRTSDATRAIVGMLDVLISTYKLELIHVSQENLHALQGQIRQALAIRSTLIGDSDYDTPKI